MQEQNIIVKNVVDIMDMSLMMGHNLQARDIAIMENVLYLKKNSNFIDV